MLSRAHLQAGPCQHKRWALPESAPLVLDKMPSPGTLEGTPLLLGLQKLPGLANTGLSALNPNIQLRATGAAVNPEDSWREVGLNRSALKSGISSCIPWRTGVLCGSDKVTPMPYLWSRRSRASSLLSCRPSRGSPSLYCLDHVVQSLSCVQLFATPWTTIRQASWSSTVSWSLLKFMSIELVMLSNHVWLDHSKGQTAPIWQGCHENQMSRECFLSCRGFLKYGQRLSRKP